MLSAMTRTARLTQAFGVAIVGLALLALTIQLIGGVMWRQLAEEWIRLSVT